MTEGMPTKMNKNRGELEVSVNGVGRNYYENNVATAKNTKSINSISSAEKAINEAATNEGAVSSSKQMAPEYANYTKEALVKDTEKDQTTFPAFNALSKLEKYFEVLREHYSKVNEENKKFASPEQHITDKYFNKNSPYYVKGLTQKEREICATQEQRVLLGMQPDLCSDDPVIREKFGGCNIFVEDMDWNQEIRGKINDAINQAFKENGIVIPKDADLRLTVDPYDFFIHASGVDEELAKRIEAALNKGRNGYYLYEHISFCDPVNYGVEEPLQYISGDKEKMVVYHFVNRLTGYDIRELENRDGKFYTPDGEDLWEVLKDKYDKLAADGNADVSTLMRYEAAYRRVATAGWERTTDCNLTIGYKDGYLYDLDTSYGYGPGQTAWQDRVRSWYEGVQKEYLREREEDLKREENIPSKFEMAVKETEDYMRLTFGEGSVSGSWRAEVQLGSKIPVLLEVLERLKKEGMIVPLTNRVLNLRGESRVIQGFDFKA